MCFISIKLSNFNWLTLTKCFERVSDRDWKGRNKQGKRDIIDHAPSSFISILFSWYHFNFFLLSFSFCQCSRCCFCCSLEQMVLFDHCIISTYSWHDTYSIYGCILYVLPPNAFCTDLTLSLARSLALSTWRALCCIYSWECCIYKLSERKLCTVSYACVCLFSTFGTAVSFFFPLHSLLSPFRIFSFYLLHCVWYSLCDFDFTSIHCRLCCTFMTSKVLNSMSKRKWYEDEHFTAYNETQTNNNNNHNSSSKKMSKVIAIGWGIKGERRQTLTGIHMLKKRTDKEKRRRRDAKEQQMIRFYCFRRIMKW